MKKVGIILAVALLVILAGCGKKEFTDPNVDDQYYIYLEDEETQQIVSDQVLYTVYKNGTRLCGYAVVQSEEQCYQMLEEMFHAELEDLKQALTEEAVKAEAAVNGSQAPQMEADQATVPPTTPEIPSAPQPSQEVQTTT